MQPRHFSWLRDLRQDSLILASVRAVGSGEEVSLDETELTDPILASVRTMGSGKEVSLDETNG